MTASEIQEAQRLADRALKNAKDAERWAMAATNNDKTGQAHQAWQFAKKAAEDLEKLKRQLNGVRPG